MKKPEPKKIEVLDWNECVDYLEKKYDFDLRDYGKKYKNWKANLETIFDRENISPKQRKMFEEDFTKLDQDNLPPEIKEHYALRRKIYDMHDKENPYRDFWHFIIDIQEVNNGGTIYFSNDSLECCKEDWQKTIMEYILSEFGKGKNRECSFRTEW